MIESLLDHITDAGYNISLDGPDSTKLTSAYRWSLRVYTNERDTHDYPVGRELFYGGSALNVLESAWNWVEIRERNDDDPIH